MKNKKIFLLLIILFLFTRLYKINSIPSSVYWDEASIGYNAYSVLKTGRDEWKEFLPLHFRAFGEFKLPVYIYSVIPFVYFLGLNELSLRLPSVFYSFLSLILIYLLVKRIFKEEKLALLSSFLFLILPWNFIFSRTGYEASSGLFFYLLFIFLWFVFSPLVFDTSKFSLKIFGVMFLLLLPLILSFYSYNSFRIISPLTFAFLFLAFFFKQNGSLGKKLIFLLLSFVIIGAFSIPIYRLYRFDSGAFRFQVLSLEGERKDKLIAFTRNYFSHFSFDFLFFGGDKNLRSQMPGFGEIYSLSLPFLFLGLLKLAKKKDFKFLFLIFLFLIAPIPASLTKESPHSLRSILFAFLMPLVISLGIIDFVAIFEKGKQKMFLALIYFSYLVFFGIYFLRFLKTYNLISALSWQSQYKQVFYDRKDLIRKSEKVVVSENYAQPYIFALFYNSYDPKEFWRSVTYNSYDRWGFSTVYSFDKFVFKKVEDQDLREGVLVFSDKEVVGQERFLVDKILVTDKVAFFVYQK